MTARPDIGRTEIIACRRMMSVAEHSLLLQIRSSQLAHFNAHPNDVCPT